MAFCFDSPMSGRILRKIKERVRDVQLQKAKQHLLAHGVSGHQPLRHVKLGRIHQPLDHFNRRSVGTFPQVEKAWMLRKCVNPTLSHCSAEVTELSTPRQPTTPASIDNMLWHHYPLLPFDASNVQICPLPHKVKDYWRHRSCFGIIRMNCLSLSQRFFVNDAYWQRPDGPVFLFIGGEGPLYEIDVLAGTAKHKQHPHLPNTHFKTGGIGKQKWKDATSVCKTMICFH